MPPKPIILAFDTAAAHCAAVVVEGDKTLSARVELMAKGQAERLFPLIEEVLTETNMTWDKLSAIAVGTGPGNFTGIRISVSAARGLSLSLNTPAIGVSRPDAMAFGTKGRCTTIIDARQNRIYVQDFIDGNAISKVRVISISEFESSHKVYCDNEVAFPAKRITTQTSLENAAQIAGERFMTKQPKPAPLYVRAPDATPPSDPSSPLLL